MHCKSKTGKTPPSQELLQELPKLNYFSTRLMGIIAKKHIVCASEELIYTYLTLMLLWQEIGVWAVFTGHLSSHYLLLGGKPM